MIDCIHVYDLQRSYKLTVTFRVPNCNAFDTEGETETRDDEARSHAPNAPLVSRSQHRSSSTCHSGWDEERLEWKEDGKSCSPVRHPRPDAASRGRQIVAATYLADRLCYDPDILRDNRSPYHPARFNEDTRAIGPRRRRPRTGDPVLVIVPRLWQFRGIRSVGRLSVDD